MKAAVLELRKGLDSIKQTIGVETAPPVVFEGISGTGEVLIPAPDGPGEIVRIPAPHLDLFRKPARSFLLSGGRSSGKSWSAGLWILSEGSKRPERILCIRQVQSSVERSSFQLLRDLCMRYSCFNDWSWTKNEFRHRNGSTIQFTGLSDVTRASLRSAEGCTLVWAEESHTLTHESLITLLPTIRASGSRLLFTYNPMTGADPVETVLKPMPDTVSRHTTFKDVELLLSPETKAMIVFDREHNHDLFLHVWEGRPRVCGEGVVFRNLSVAEFSYDELRAQWESGDAEEPLPSPDTMFADDFRRLLRERKRPKAVGLQYGCDWGFSQDPSAGVRLFVSPTKRELYIEYEYHAIGVTIDRLPGELIRALPGIEKSSQVCGDASRPELVNFMQGHGIPGMKSARRWKGSVEDGIEFLRSLDKITIHERCERAISEFQNYSYVLDKSTGAPLPELQTTDNHLIDSTRYAAQSFIKPEPGYQKLRPIYV